MVKDKYEELSVEDRQLLWALYEDMMSAVDASCMFDSSEVLEAADKAEKDFYEAYDRLLGKDYPYFHRHFYCDQD